VEPTSSGNFQQGSLPKPCTVGCHPLSKTRDSCRTLTKLRAKHAETANSTFGIDGLTGQIADMKELGIWEPYEVKVQTMKTAIEAAAMLMRIDDIVSGIQRKSKDRTSQPQQPQTDDGENVRCFVKLFSKRRFPCYGLLMVVCRGAGGVRSHATGLISSSKA